MSRSRHLRSPSPPRGGRSSRRAAGVRSAWSALLLGLAMVAPSGAAEIVGSDASDNNSYTFPEWRSQLNGTGANDQIMGRQGDDLLYGYGGDDGLYGNPGADTLYGGDGRDQLAGGVGDRDLLYGGRGDDVYVVLDSFDVVRELAGQGLDTVASFVDYILPANVENLFLRPNTLYGGVDYDPPAVFMDDCAVYTGPFPCHQLGSFGMGNGLANEIRGNQMDNDLRGLGGADLMYGFGGSDELDGGTGDDMLAGFLMNGSWASAEWDILTGGSGADVFVTGISGRPGGLPIAIGSERFPQYLGQGLVWIMDFDWREGDKIEVYGDPADYWIELYHNPWDGDYAAIYWDGSAEGFGARELVGYAMGISSSSDLIPALDFL